MGWLESIKWPAFQLWTDRSNTRSKIKYSIDPWSFVVGSKFSFIKINHRKLRNSKSKKIMDVVEYALRNTKIESGKIFVISGLNHEL